MFNFNVQMRLIQNVKFPVSVLVSEAKTEGNPYEMYDILTGAVVEKVGQPAWTETGKLSAGARVGDPTTGRVVFVNGLGDNAKLINNLKPGEIIHVVGERRLFNGAVNFRLIGFLDEAPIVESGRFKGTVKEPAEVSEYELAAAVTNETL